MLLHDWPPRDRIPALDRSEVRDAVASRDADRFIAAVTGREIDDALDVVAEGIPLVLEKRHRMAEPVALSVVNRLSWRGGPGDEELAEKLLAALRGK